MTEANALTALPSIPLIVREGRALVTSREVAEFFGKRHDDVLKKLRALECSEEFNRRNFAEISHVDAMNRPQPMVEMTRDGFTFLAMGFTGPRAAQFKEAFIAAFNQMEDQLRGGAVLPVLTQSVTRMQGQIEALMLRQAEDSAKLNAVLDLVDVTKKYVGLLEANQKVTKPTKKLTPEIVAEVLELLGQGMSSPNIAKTVGIGYGQVWRIRKGQIGALETNEALREARMRDAQQVLATMQAQREGGAA